MSYSHVSLRNGAAFSGYCSWEWSVRTNCQACSSHLPIILNSKLNIPPRNNGDATVELAMNIGKHITGLSQLPSLLLKQDLGFDFKSQGWVFSFPKLGTLFADTQNRDSMTVGSILGSQFIETTSSGGVSRIRTRYKQ